MAHKILVLGLGRIGRTIAIDLHSSGQYEVTGVDVNPQCVNQVQANCPDMHVFLISGQDYQSILKEQDVVISALSFVENPKVAEAALAAGCSYFDLTEDVACTQAIKKIASRAKAGQIFMPQCGLAPGFVGILGHSFIHEFDQLDTLKLRVGALPEFPANQMMYNLTWSTEGLVNEYANPCEAIKNGEQTLTEPLEGRELFSISGVDYEAFNTSGGLSNLCNSLQGKVRELNYKTIRYPGHCALMRFLFRDLRLGEVGERREMLLKILETSVAVTQQDFVLISVVATGNSNGSLMQKSRSFYVRHATDNGNTKSAIQLTTASGVCTVVDIMMNKLESDYTIKGFVEQESIEIQTFLSSPFAKVYAQSEL